VQLFQYLGEGTPVDTLDRERLRAYFLYCANDLKLSENTLHSRINAVKFYSSTQEKGHFAQRAGELAGRTAFFAAREPKVQDHAISGVLRRIAGERSSEYIHSERMVINIKGGKGKRDRTVALLQGILELLRKYYVAYKPQDWLFEGQSLNSPYSTRSLQQIFRIAKTAARILQDVTFQGLRHSYAPHLHKAGTDLKLIQELLGHNDIKTTLRYTHVSNRTLENIKSPFENLNLKN
jgi:integrase